MDYKTKLKFTHMLKCLWLMELSKLTNWVNYLTEYIYCMSEAVSHLLIAKHVTESIV